MLWASLVPELRRECLFTLTLPQLRLVKAVSRSTANDCRAVLRSDRWQCVGANRYALREEIKTQPLHEYKLPLTVTLCPEEFAVRDWLIATIHRLTIHRVDDHGELCDPSEKGSWSWEKLHEFDCTPSDMLIEVHGHGIFGSEASLRQFLQQHMRAHGVDTTHDYANVLWSCTLTGSGFRDYGVEDDWSQLCLYQLLGEIYLVTNVGANAWIINECPLYNQRTGNGREAVSVLTLMRRGCPLFFE